MDEHGALALNFAADLAKQLITLATGILALSITFTRDVLEARDGRGRGTLKASWILYLVSVIFGIWSLMALTGLAEQALKESVDSIDIGFNAKFPAQLQLATFVLATVSMSVFGIQVLGARRGPPATKETMGDEVRGTPGPES